MPSEPTPAEAVPQPAANRGVLAAARDVRAQARDSAAEARDGRASHRDQRARLVTHDADPACAERFMAAGDRDDAAGDRADALADRRAAGRDFQELVARGASPPRGIQDGPSFLRALEDRGMIGIAQGLLMAGLRVTVDRAFELLLEESLGSNRRMRDVASELVAEGNGRGSQLAEPDSHT
ncbi:MAG: hypothetical protein JWN67_5328 [Actinomycetia bacterium]|nr:hypothetical protein [Actinomycetes bacterium]